jgi:hypothetical protein
MSEPIDKSFLYAPTPFRLPTLHEIGKRYIQEVIINPYEPCIYHNLFNGGKMKFAKIIGILMCLLAILCYGLYFYKNDSDYAFLALWFLILSNSFLIVLKIDELKE